MPIFFIYSGRKWEKVGFCGDRRLKLRAAGDLPFLT
jgi:hypothetical protein